jgi:putative membrane protein
MLGGPQISFTANGTHMIRLVLVGILLLLSLSFFLHNQEQEVTLRYFFGLRSASTPIYKPILSAFALGLLVASILLFPAWVRGRLELRRKTKALQETEADLEELRASLGKSTQPGNVSDEELSHD